MNNIREHYSGAVFLTGATSGIGKAYAYYLARHGFNLYIVSHEIDALSKTKFELLELNPSITVIEYRIDLNDIDNLIHLLENQNFSDVRIVINAAGIGLVGAVLNNKLVDYLRLSNVNAIAPFVISYFFANEFFRRNIHGAIINITTANSEIGLPIPYCSVYTSLKCFMKYFTEGLAFEMEHHHIDILNVACGPTDTNFQKVAGTKKLFWCESPESVVLKSFNALGKKKVIITNPYTRLLLVALKYLPFLRRWKVAMVAKFYGEILGDATSAKLNRKSS